MGLRGQRENADCLIPRLNSKKAGKKAAQKPNPLEAAIHLKSRNPRQLALNNIEAGDFRVGCVLVHL